ncbi:MAG: MBL fold metallo-hydrolase, partial [Alphaproteobacteria bacterium]|nr:MBL fold metallo-hydrolase [Alphaproteobacteria bacterium]
MPRLIPLSGLGTKGPACFLVEADRARLLLDLGAGPDGGRRPDVGGVGSVDAVLLSHAHPDHAGALDLLPALGDPPVHATPRVAAHVVGFGGPAAVRPDLPTAGTVEIAGIPVTTGRSGHAPGGVWLHLGVGQGLFYAG